MRVELRAVTKGRRERALPETSLTFETGSAALVCAETEQRPTVLGLIAAGRMRPDSGSVTIDGRADAAALRRSVALVDALDVSEPEPNVSVAGVVAEELMFAGLASHPIAARRWLDEHGLGGVASTPIGNVAPGERIRILCELAALRSGVRALVLTSPDRHGGDPEVWWRIAEEFATRGLAVLVIAGKASQSVLGVGAASESRNIAASSEDSGEILRADADSPRQRDERAEPGPGVEPMPEPDAEPGPDVEPGSHAEPEPGAELEPAPQPEPAAEPPQEPGPKPHAEPAEEQPAPDEQPEVGRTP